MNDDSHTLYCDHLSCQARPCKLFFSPLICQFSETPLISGVDTYPYCWLKVWVERSSSSSVSLHLSLVNRWKESLQACLKILLIICPCDSPGISPVDDLMSSTHSERSSDLLNRDQTTMDSAIVTITSLIWTWTACVWLFSCVYIQVNSCESEIDASVAFRRSVSSLVLMTQYYIILIYFQSLTVTMMFRNSIRDWMKFFC